MANAKTIIHKGLNNKKDYLLHTLQNGMKCLLISQPENEYKIDTHEYTHNKSTNCSNEYDDEVTDGLSNSCSNQEEEQTRSETFAMSLSVSVGSFNDPIEAQGLAHLLEHMISMGIDHSEENHNDKFLRRKIGSYNAETGCEYTIFYYNFITTKKYSRGKVNDFASMFQAPTLSKKSIDKEKQLVDSEFQLVNTEDGVRMQRLLSLCASKDCPAINFICGNLKSLNHKKLDKIILDFWKNHYSASRMYLAVQSQQTTQEMIELIDDFFSKIPTDNLPKPEMTFCKVPFNLNTFHKIYKILSVGSVKKITFFWYLPPTINLYKYKPLEYISWVVQHEGKGSLINYLRKLNYAMELVAGVDDNFFNNNIYSLFPITIELTDLGLENVDMVIELTFSYLALIRQQGISENIFKQIQTLAENEFNLSENESAPNHVIELSLNMMNYDEEDYLSGPVLFFEYSSELIETYLKLMSVNRVALFVFSKNYDQSDFLLTEDIFGTKYSCDNFKEELENKWSNVKPHPFFKIPSDNPYITTDFSILPQSTYIKYPQKILENEHIELWHKQDNCFNLPKGYIMLNFINQVSSKSLENNVHLSVFLLSVSFLLNEDIYPTIMAKLYYNVQVHIHGFELTFEGYNEKLPLLIDIVLNCVKNYKNLITEEIFNMVKSQAINKLKNKQYDLNYIIYSLTNSLILEPEWYLDNKLCYLEKLEYSQLLTFYEQLLSNLYCQALIQGNINQNQAIEISKKVVNTLKYQPLDKKCFPVVLVKRLNQGDCRVKLTNYNRIDNNSMAYTYYQFENCEITESMKYYVLQLIMRESAFDELRTKQCLGYDIQLNLKIINQHYGFYFQVTHQRNKFDTQYVFSRMNEFLKQFWEKFNDPEEVYEVRNSLIASYSSDECLEVEFNRNKNEILENQFKFNRLELEIESLKNLTFEDVANLKHGFLSGNTFSVEIIGNSTKENHKPIKKLCVKGNKNYICIKDLEEYKNSLNSY
ncbi:Peptidase M16, middle/third domain,Peptidase M16, C-terminal,Metalloenzyme, LuxS/M16 peptidase- [Cinara cedri]|uniref:Peptidase M16, middle/third domain,Peptidase M16, C-terminal,Metalloenzyme, LuxS/M16 peptidase n=1 Tax=Cinara cedri TaxID=506608 RepID=A0A5E4MCV8_9HEMI|nr:Peptidase M16, middle/third domain,Peptidase M16, C-terminal,Metalloenzyme, LuxS/M16 peptidase- [Cinara cedri]